ncbi:hypothetical protein HDU92_006384 [Lobulomyces angularis]|nr:hypothetical protein HDU92_006384 [Lobulomyces angularis]
MFSVLPIPNLYDDLNDLEFENLLSGGVQLQQRQSNNSFWDSLVSLFHRKKQGQIRLESDVNSPTFPQADDNFLDQALDEDVDILSVEDVQRITKNIGSTENKGSSGNLTREFGVKRENEKLIDFNSVVEKDLEKMNSKLPEPRKLNNFNFSRKLTQKINPSEFVEAINYKSDISSLQNIEHEKEVIDDRPPYKRNNIEFHQQTSPARPNSQIGTIASKKFTEDVPIVFNQDNPLGQKSKEGSPTSKILQDDPKRGFLKDDDEDIASDLSSDDNNVEDNKQKFDPTLLKKLSSLKLKNDSDEDSVFSSFKFEDDDRNGDAGNFSYEEDDDDIFQKPFKTKKKKSFSLNKSNNDCKKAKIQAVKKYELDPQILKELSALYPDTINCYKNKNIEVENNFENEKFVENKIEYVNNLNTLELKYEVAESGPISSMDLSTDGNLIATFCSTGSTKIWDVDTGNLLKNLRDKNEINIEEHYVGKFLRDDDSLICVGGKLKDRKSWSNEDDDNQILPCPIKIFDIISGKVILTLNFHNEEILDIKKLKFKEKNYLLSTSQDGYINKWSLNDDWSKLESFQKMKDEVTCMAFSISFLPNSGNKFFIAACDDSLRLYDFETCELIHSFEQIFSYYCDFVKFINPVEIIESELVDDEEEFSYILTRGVETLDMEDNTINSLPNKIYLHKLIYPKEKLEEFKLIKVKEYMHEE